MFSQLCGYHRDQLKNPCVHFSHHLLIPHHPHRVQKDPHYSSPQNQSIQQVGVGVMPAHPGHITPSSFLTSTLAPSSVPLATALPRQLCPLGVGGSRSTSPHQGGPAWTESNPAPPGDGPKTDLGPDAAQQEVRSRLGASGESFVGPRTVSQGGRVSFLHPAAIRGNAPRESMLRTTTQRWKDPRPLVKP